ncbi:MAG TPA: TerB family tellurite resistance protein [Rhizomicrobium sp.]|jgi:hypothetical protein
MSFGILVGRFGQFVREYNDTPVSVEMAEPAFPLDQDVREAIAHHLIPLALLARSDGDEADSEIAAIHEHLIVVLTNAGKSMSDDHKTVLKSYIAEYRPSLAQLDPALRRLEKENADTMIALLAAARAVVMADGRIDPAEARLLDELKLELAKA